MKQEKKKRFNFLVGVLEQVRLYEVGGNAGYYRPAWDEPASWATPDRKLYWVLSMVMPLHYPVRTIACLFGGWSRTSIFI